MNKLKRTVVVLCVGVLICGGVVLSVIGLGQSAFAEDVSSTQMLQKAQILNMRHCVNDFNFFKTDLSEDDYNGKEGIKGAYKSILDGSNQNGGYIYVPNQVDNNVGNGWHETPSITCKDLFDGTSKLQNIFSLFGKSSHPPLADIGYDLDNSADDGSIEGCLYFDYEYSGDDKMPRSGRTNKVCMTVGSNGNIDNSGRVCSNIKDEGGANGPLKLECNPNDNSIRLRSTDPFANTGGSIAEFSGSTSWQDGVKRNFVNEVVNELGEGSILNELYGYKVGSNPFHFDETKYDGKIKATYNKSQAANRVLNYLTGSTNWGNWSFNTKDRYYLYTAYLNNELSKSGSSLRYGECGNKTTAKEKSDSGIAIRNGDKWCALMNVSSVGTKYNAPSGSGGMLTPTSFTNVMKALMDLDYDYLEEQGVEIGAITGDGTITNPVESGNNSGSNNNSNTSGGSSTTSELSACYQGAGVLGWIACPVIEAVGGATSYLYERVVEPLLEIKASTIMGRDKGAYSAWSAFRGFTNVLFAIGFAVVILAQLTGIGISNYNIKKILPRLIMVAVLVNISFVICQFAVDISNLIGSGIEKVFKALPMTYEAGGGSILAMGGIFSGLTAALGLTAVGAALSLPVAAATLSYWIWPILLGLLSCLVGILFFFIVLAVRQAGVIILVILSPIAIICYALPNTKSIFDRWRKMFTSLLVVYPICSLLMYGGQYAGALMLSINSGADDNLGMFYTITAMLVMVLPFFAIPSILKGSMAMMGNIGAKISNFGNGVRGGLTRNIRGTRAFQEHQAEEQRRLNLRRDQTRVGRLSATGKGGGMVGRARRALGWNNNLSDRNMVRAALAQSNIDKTTDTTAQAMRARWESDGTINNLKELENKYKEATEKLMKDPGDEEALQMQKAASVALASTKPGRSHLYAANDDLINQVTTMTGDQRKAAENVMRRTANNLLRTNGGDIGKSPLLDEQLSQLQNPPDGSGGRTAGYEGIKDAMLHDSIGKLNARSMSEMYKKDLDAYLKAVGDGDIKGDDLRRLSAAARSAINDPRYNGMIGAEAMEKMRQLANLGYSQHAADADASSGAAWAGRTQSIATASNEEISRIREGLRNGSFDNGDTEAIKSTLAHSLMRAASGDGSYNMSTNRAEEINRILQENGIDLSSMDQAALDNLGATDYALTSDQIKNGIVNATGMKIEHPPAHKPTMRQLHPGWGQATAEQVRRAQIVNPSGPAIREGDWINVDDRGNIVRLRPDEVVEATKLMDREAEARINEGDERFNQQSNQQGSSS